MNFQVKLIRFLETLSMSSIEILASDLPIKEAEIDKDNVSSNKIKTIISSKQHSFSLTLTS
jgi:hypothetical protein